MTRNLDRFLTMVQRNKGLKLMALTLATVTWLYIRDTTSFEETIRDVPLIISASEGWAVQDISTKQVAITFRGSQADIRNLDRSQIRVQAIARVRNGEPTMVLNLGRANVSAPRAVRPLYITPSEVLVTLDRETEKEVRVGINAVGAVPEGYFIEDSGIAPNRIKIYGPERRLAEIDTVYTAPIDLAGRIRSFSNNIPLLPPSELPMARMDVREAAVSFTITEFTVSREFKAVPVKLLLPPGGGADVSLKPATVNVMLRGRVNVISNLTERAVHAFVDASQLTDPEVAELPVEVNVGVPGVSVMAIDPVRVQVNRNDRKK